MYELSEYFPLDQDVLKTSSEDGDERRLQDVFIKTNVSWVETVDIDDVKHEASAN